MNFSRKALIQGVVCVAMLSTGALVYARFNPQPDPPGHYYGLMTVDAGQHVSLHVANTKMAVDTFRPETSMCTARLEFVGACGQVLARGVGRISPGASRSLNFTVPTPDQLPPGPCADPPGSITGGDVLDTSRDVTSDLSEFDPPAPIRMRAQVVFMGDAGHCISSVEVGDPFVGAHGTGGGGGSGVTGGGGSGFIHPGLIVGFNPQPDPPGAPTKTPQ
jgi:hypothetical protein